MREFISELECSAYKSKKAPKLGQAKHMFNTRVEFEIKKKLWRYQNDGNTATFKKFFTHNNAVCKADRQQCLQNSEHLQKINPRPVYRHFCFPPPGKQKRVYYLM